MSVGAADIRTRDWRKPTPFVVLTAGRSGSSFLIDALKSHPRVLCFGEILEEPNADSLTHRGTVLRAIGPEECVVSYCDEVVYGPAIRGYDAVGFKVKYYHLEGNQLAYYFLERKVRVIHNSRLNLLAQSLSLPLAESHEFADFLDDPDHAGRYAQKIGVDVEEIISRAEENLQLMGRFRKIFAGAFEVAYECICHSDELGNVVAREQVDGMLQFLGLNSFPLQSCFVRQRTKPYCELIRNFDELRTAALHRHPEWQSMLVDLDRPFD